MPESEPPEEKEEAQPEGNEEAVSRLEIGWILPAVLLLGVGVRDPKDLGV